MAKAARTFKNLTFLAIGSIAGAVALGGLRAWSLRWGADPLEEGGYLPGDEAMAYADHQSTRAITIRTAPSRVWPWIAQIGTGRAGFYSYDWLENLCGLDIHSADKIVPDLQGIAVGDTVSLAKGVDLQVAELEPESHLVLTGTGVDDKKMPFEFSWAFVLHQQAPARTRLIVRERYRYLGPLAAAIVEPVSLVSFLMSQRMLTGIKARAEATD
ncbi:SRPBCC family protein [Rarobacter incanus]|uniref:Polyketide cyclase/dehydrase/lipid transport protein n=1 Tax=Rarobacter incanus TaxID=153494 RepID=A0A542SPB8_9MICO|nr:SRPBCC family protein [Rarobacter incanus]TQK76463.1 hypothetical protein FB389_1136 [Rarobacter incanus]